MTVKEEYTSLGTETLKSVMNKLKQELKSVKSGKRRDYFSSEVLTKTNVLFVEMLNNNFYSTRDKMLNKSAKFRADDKNIEKFQLNHKKDKFRKEAEYMALAYPTIEDDVWEVELEMSLVLSALKASSEAE